MMTINRLLSLLSARITAAKMTLLMTTLILAACGGGGSSSGSDNNDFAGTYEGGGDMEFTVGQQTGTDYAPTKVIVHPDGKLDVSDGSANVSTSGNIDGENFQVAGRFVFNENGFACDMTIQYSGVIKPDNGIETANGNVSGQGQCNGEPSSLNGVFTARKISDVAKSPVNSGFKENFRSLMQ